MQDGFYGPSAEIRTRGLLNPIQARLISSELFSVWFSLILINFIVFATFSCIVRDVATQPRRNRLRLKSLSYYACENICFSHARSTPHPAVPPLTLRRVRTRRYIRASPTQCLRFLSASAQSPWWGIQFSCLSFFTVLSSIFLFQAPEGGQGGLDGCRFGSAGLFFFGGGLSLISTVVVSLRV